jgi:hypothetical protein
MELVTILGAITPLKGLLEFINNKRATGSAQHEEALVALYTALNETKIYIGELEQNPNARNHETEKTLFRLWTVASTKIHTIDQQWGITCFQKGDYWANPDSWTQDDIQKAGIGIDEVFQRAKQLL